MVNQDCGCGSKGKDVVNTPLEPGQGAHATGGSSLVQALVRAAEVLGGDTRTMANSEVVDALSDALLMCREEKKALAEALDEVHADLEECQDQLSEDEGDLDIETGDEDNGFSSTSIPIPEKTLSQALQQKNARSQSVIRQDRVVQQHGRDLSGVRVGDGSEGVRSDNRDELRVSSGRHVLEQLGKRESSVRVLQREDSGTSRGQQHPGELLYRLRDPSEDVGGHMGAGPTESSIRTLVLPCSPRDRGGSMGRPIRGSVR